MLITSMMDAFLDACGDMPALELEVAPTSTTQAVRYCLRQPLALIGRHPAADVYLDADGVRPRHVYLQAVEGRIACVNVAQSSSFAANDQEVQEFCWLPADRSIRIGARDIRVLEDQAGVPAARVTVTNPLAAGSAYEIFAPRITLELENLEKPGSVWAWQIDRIITLVGSTKRCAIRLIEESISNVHCSLVLTGTGLWVVDLLGRDGILINEEPVRVGHLGLEDVLRIGPYRMRWQLPTALQQIPQRDSDFTPLTPASEFDLSVAEPTVVPAESSSASQIRSYQTPWPMDADQAALLDEMMDLFQEMQDPVFAQHQHMLSRMIESFGRLTEEERREVRKELERLRRIRQEVETITQKRQADLAQKAKALPDAAPPGRSDTREDVVMPADKQVNYHPDPTETPPPPRSAATLLTSGDSSVFRIPKKKGDLFESIPMNELQAQLNPPKPSWAGPDTEKMSADLSGSSETKPLTAEMRRDPATEVVTQALHYTSRQAGSSAGNVVIKPTSTPSSIRMDALQQEQTSIWKKMSQFFFGK